MYEKEKETKKERFVIFPDVKRILKKNAAERTEQNIQDLAYYFRNNPYFINYQKDNGMENLSLLYKAMKFQVCPLSFNL